MAETMRLDKFLKISRLIKRRTVANSACDIGRVSVNDRPAKAGHKLKAGDKITVEFGNRAVSVRVLRIAESVKKEEADSLYEVIEG